MLRLLIFVLVILFSANTYSAEIQNNKIRNLSLNEAILLAARQNPNVIQSQLDHVLSKFALEIQEWQFQPHYALQATTTTERNYSVTRNGYVSQNSTGINPSVSLLTPYGTQATLTASNNIGHHYNPALSLQIMQPLMRGFGKAVVEAALFDARDSEKISRLGVEDTVKNTVTTVINAYLDVISAQNTLAVDIQALNNAKETEKQTEVFIKAGHKAGVEIVTVQAEVASAQKRIEDDRNNLDQAKYALLTTIGIDPNTQVTFSDINIPALIQKYRMPSLDVTKQMSLENDIQYQTDEITLNGSTKRSLLSAEDNTRWKLDLTVNASTGGGTGGGENAGINSLVNGVNQNNSAMLNLTIPIDDRPAKVAVESAKIALQEAEIALQQEKWAKETVAINSWKTIFSAKRSLGFAEDAEDLQRRTYRISFKKYSYGLIDSLELQTAVQHWHDAQQALINSQILYLKSLVNLDLLIGHTLETWHIKVRYS